MGENLFGVVDFVLFVGLLLISVSIGIYSAFKGGKNETTEHYYFGNRKMSAFPLACSMTVSFLSAISMMATPTEVYMFGAVICWVIVGNVLAVLFSCVYFVPLVLRLNLSSIYEYLERRFDRRVRLFCSSVTIFQMVFYMGCCIYIPALALNTVTPLDIKWTILLTSFVCTFYTTLGGFKAVVWSDVVQGAIMLVGSAALFIQATALVGGPADVWDAVNRGGRMNIFKLTMDPTVRSSLLPVLIGSTFLQSASICSNQAMAQRIMSCKSVKHARRTFLYYFFPWAVIFILCIANGCALFAYYEGCDLLRSRKINKPDQYIPSLMVDAFRDVPGLSGLFVAAACSGTLSTVSSGINSLSVVILHDFVLQMKRSTTSRQKLWIGKICGVIIGLLVTLIAYTIGYLGTTTIQVATSSMGIFGGPIFGVFLAGMFIPRTNAKGALVGVILSLSLTLWIAVGAAVYGLSPEKKQLLPLSTKKCNVSHFPNHTTVYSSTQTMPNTSPAEENVSSGRPLIADTLYSISFYYFGMVGTVSSLLFTAILSAVTGGNDPRRLNSDLFVPLLKSKQFSPALRKIFRCGVPEDGPKLKPSTKEWKLILMDNDNCRVAFTDHEVEVTNASFNLAPTISPNSRWRH